MDSVHIINRTSLKSIIHAKNIIQFSLSVCVCGGKEERVAWIKQQFPKIKNRKNSNKVNVFFYIKCKFKMLFFQHTILFCVQSEALNETKLPYLMK